MSRMKRSKLAGAVAAFAASLACGTAFAAAPFLVTSNADSGAGTLREALESGATQIRFDRHVRTIRVHSSLEYMGTDPLRIIGNDTRIIASDDFDILSLPNGASLRASSLLIIGPGGFDFDNQGTVGGRGIFIDVPGTRTGTVQLDLRNVTVRGVAYHGIHVSDCILEGASDTLGDVCGAGAGGEGDGSPASVNVFLRNVTVRDTGNGLFDADGVRVDERADGSVFFLASGSRFLDNGADGVELDEAGDGDVVIDVTRSHFNRNGAYCVPAPLDLAEPCVEDDDGELVRDLDDAFDIDEADGGSIFGRVANATLRRNLDEGIDFDEAGDGGMDVDFIDIDGIRNGDEAIKMSAENEGDVYAELRRNDIRNNGNDGTEFEVEEGMGEVHVRIGNSFIADNDSEGVAAAQENMMDLGTLRIRRSFVDEVDLENVVEE